jgi:hypothetical protein
VLVRILEFHMNDTNARSPGTNSTPPKCKSQQPKSRYEKFAATQAAGDGVQGDTLKSDKTEAEKIGANMADRK